MSQNGYSGGLVAGLEELRVHIDGEFEYLLAREERRFNLLPGILRFILHMSRSVITVPRLYGDTAPVLQRNLETVKAAVQLQVLRREAQQVDIFRRGRQPPEAFIQVIAVLVECSARAGG